jgi:hypothetical protein
MKSNELWKLQLEESILMSRWMYPYVVNPLQNSENDNSILLKNIEDFINKRIK